MAALPQRMRFHVASTTVVIAGMAGGAVVGFWDGLFAAVRAGVGAMGVLSTVALVTAVDLLVGGLVATVGVWLYKLARWGRRTGAPAAAIYAAWAICGLGAAGVAAATITGTAIRNNRFLAAGIVAALTVLVAAVGALISPAIARLFGRSPSGSGSGRRRPPGAWDEPLAPTPTGVLVLAPLCALLLGGIIFLIVWRTRAPLTPSVRTTRTVLAAIVAVLLPAALTLASTRGQRLNWRAAAGVALVVLGIPALLFLRANWTRHLQFLPWKDGRVLLYVIAAGAVLLLFLRWRPPRRTGRLAIVLLTPPLAGGLALWAGAAEPARKAATTEAGLAGTALALDPPGPGLRQGHLPGPAGRRRLRRPQSRRQPRSPRLARRRPGPGLRRPRPARRRPAPAAAAPGPGHRPARSQHPADRDRHPARRSPGQLRLQAADLTRDRRPGRRRRGVRERLGPRPLDPLLDARPGHRPLALRHQVGAARRWRDQVVAGLLARASDHRRGPARPRATSTAPSTPTNISTAPTAAASSAASTSTTTAWPPSTSTPTPARPNPEAAPPARWPTTASTFCAPTATRSSSSRCTFTTRTSTTSATPAPPSSAPRPPTCTTARFGSPTATSAA